LNSKAPESQKRAAKKTSPHEMTNNNKESNRSWRRAGSWRIDSSIDIDRGGDEQQHSDERSEGRKIGAAHVQSRWKKGLHWWKKKRQQCVRWQKKRKEIPHHEHKIDPHRRVDRARASKCRSTELKSRCQREIWSSERRSALTGGSMRQRENASSRKRTMSS